MTTIDIKNISVYNFIEIINSKWIIEQYLKDLPNIKKEYFSYEEEKDKTLILFKKISKDIDNNDFIKF